MNEILRCSFCKKSQDEVRKVIAGPTVFICDECVEVCLDIILDDTRFREGPPGPPDQRQLSLATKSGGVGACSLCGKRELGQHLLPIEGRGLLCGECADAIEDVLSRGRPIE